MQLARIARISVISLALVSAFAPWVRAQDPMVVFLDAMGEEDGVVLFGEGDLPVEAEPEFIEGEGEAERKRSELEKAFGKLKLKRTPQ